MPFKIEAKCLICAEDKVPLKEEVTATCDLCGETFQADSTCVNGHYVCHMCRQKAAREGIIKYCQTSEHTQPYPLLLELMKLPGVAMHGPEHHLLLTAALLTAYCNEKGKQKELAEYLDEANSRSIGVPGAACGFWGICGAAIGSGIYMSILTEASPYAEVEWKAVGQCTVRCADAVSKEGGPRCCKRDSFLSMMEAIEHSNNILGTHFEAPEDIRCTFYPNNEECKQRACPFFPTRK
ncbi:DUF5714 domain-containing protein [Eubacteriales bacterium OttesenSCG-928-M02]|nr:DUF5714 domain-containing protein [Eubacteriales bacterium OttesenSCG-928-M02]